MSMQHASATHRRLPFSGAGALKALELGVYGTAGGALVGGLAATAAAPVAIAAAAPALAGVGLAVIGYRLGSRSARAAQA